MPELRTKSIAVLGAGAAQIGTALAVTAAAAGAATTVAAPVPSPPGRPSQCTGTSPITCHFAVSPRQLHRAGLDRRPRLGGQHVDVGRGAPPDPAGDPDQALVESLGPTASARLYLRAAVDGVKDDTHFSEYGAGRIAGLVVQGIRERTLSLTDYLR
jgi:hypothetical protein